MVVMVELELLEVQVEVEDVQILVLVEQAVLELLDKVMQVELV
jgi:hypothetical protein